MKTVMLSIVTLVAAAIIAGCSDRSVSPDESFDQAQFTVTPGDGVANVNLDTPIVFTFRKSADRQNVERNFFLISEKGMADSLCPVSTMMSHGNMMTAMSDSSKMHHLDQYHSTRGRFTWNGESTQCTFQPDSLMTSGTHYMIHIGRDMVRMIEQRMGDMGMMGGHGTSIMSSDMMLHFWTNDTIRGIR